MIGDGRPAHPYRAVNTDSPLLGTSRASHVDLSFAGPLTSITFAYSQDGKVSGDPFIGISHIVFQNCS